MNYDQKTALLSELNREHEGLVSRLIGASLPQREALLDALAKLQRDMETVHRIPTGA